MLVKTTPVFSVLTKLAKLRADESRLDVQIEDTQAALKLAQKRVSERLAQRYTATNDLTLEIPEELMKEEDAFERLLLALRDMKDEITKQIRPVEEQLIQTNLEHLHQSFNEESQNLAKCVSRMDDAILACQQHLQDYQSIVSGLEELNDKLNQIGAEPVTIPDRLPISDFGEILQQRLHYLRSQGKI
jgi:CII-binding regulator of phage lambda lysogenization HflD